MNEKIETSSNREFINTICEIIKNNANRDIEQKGRFTFVLSGGKTPKIIFQYLALNYKDTIEWCKVHFFWLDERCVEPTHKDSNYKLAFDNLICKLDRIGSLHRIKGELEPDQAAKEYKKEIVRFFKDDDVEFDFILLGMGEDGHVASVFPESRELEENESLVVSTRKQYYKHKRITLTLPVIRISKKILMIGNKKKLEIFYDKNRNLPVHMVGDENMKIVVKK